MRKQLLSIRRWGVAALAGVTLLGGVLVLGESAASAATPTVYGSGQATTVPTSIGTATFVPSGVTLNITGVVTAADTITLTLACAAAGTQAWTDPDAATPILGGDGVMSWSTPAAATSNGACGSGVDNNFVLHDTVVPTSNTATSVNTLTIPGADLTMALAGVPSGNITVTGTYVNASGSYAFTLPTIGAVANVSVTPATPLTSVAPASGDVSLGNLTITLPANNTVPATTDFVCVLLSQTPGAVTFDTVSGAPTVTQTNGASNATVSTPAVTAGGTTQDKALAFQETALSTENPPSFQLSNLHVDVPAGSTIGAETVEIGWSTTQAGCDAPANALVTGQTAFEIGTAPAGAVYGTTADATTAAEFDKAFVTVAGGVATCSNSGNAVIATDADPYDALSAAYLEAQLGTGILITSPTGLDPNTLAALQYAGVSRVYIVGGPLAVSQTVISQLQGLKVTSCGGLTTTTTAMTVYPSIYGATADDTAVAIDNYITGNGEGGTGANLLPALTSAYGTAATYNQTIGNESTSAPTGSQTTAIVVSDTDYQDAAAAAGIAYKYHLPVILTPATGLGSQASGELTKLGITQVIALGGQLALTNAVVTSIQAMTVNSTPVAVLRVAGIDETQTAADLAQLEGTIFKWNESVVIAAQGSYWSDALGAAALSAGALIAPGAGNPGIAAAADGSAVLLTEGPTVNAGSYTDALLTKAGTPTAGLGGGLTTSIQILGGPLAVPQTQISEMQAALAAG